MQNIVQKIAVIFVVIFFSNLSWGLEARKERKVTRSDFPAVVLGEILKFENPHDFPNFFLVCTSWSKLANDERFWAAYAKSHEVSDFRVRGGSWKQAVQRWATIVPYVLKMAVWSPAEREYAVSEEGLGDLRRLALQKTKQSVIKNLKLHPRDGVNLLGAFLAYYTVDVSAFGAAIRDFAREFPAHSIIDEARYDAWRAIRDSANHDAWYDATRAAWNAARDVAKEAAFQTLNTLKPNGSAVENERAALPISLYLQAFGVQNECRKECFDRAFFAARRKLEAKQFSMTVDEVLAIIGDSTWENKTEPGLAENIHIVALKEILESSAQPVD